MKLPLLLLLLLWADSGPVAARHEHDSFGGDTSRPCHSATGFFYAEKANGAWQLCPPQGHKFFAIGVDAVAPADSPGAIERLTAKYGDTDAAWGEATVQRLQHWGFNSLGTYASHSVEPTYVNDKFPKDEYHLHSHPTKLPFITIVRPAYYAMKADHRYLPEPVKNVLYGVSPFYRGYSPSHGVPDYYDTKLDNWIETALNNETYWRELRESRYKDYLIGVACEDGDQIYGFGAGDEFPTVPSRGYNNSHLSWLIATVAPTQVANTSTHSLYSDTAVHTKLAWRDFLETKYGAISALNAAWGSNYTTFESSGTVVADEYVATGDGKTTTFVHRFSHSVPARFSVQFKLASKVIAGDVITDSHQRLRADGQIFGPDISGSVDYLSGTATISFATALASGSVISVDYVQNGWGTGSGLLDEDGRPQHQKWLGADFRSLSDSNLAVRSDMNSFLQEVSGHFFNTCRAGIKAAFPNTMYLGPDTLGSYGVPPRPEVLQAAAKNVDVLLLAGSGGFKRKVLDYIAKYSNGKPIIEVNFRAANPDSDLATFPMDSGVPGFSNQSDRGRDYARTIAYVRHASTSTGLQPYVGTLWWQYADNWNERINWGLVTLLDNAYDGHEDVRQAVNCSSPLQNLACGGEQRNYGDLISTVEQANLGLAPAEKSAWFERRSLSLLGLSVLSLTIAAAYVFFRPSASSRQ